MTGYVEEPPTERVGGPLFIIGLYRSGTSLAYSLLNQHPNIQVLFETAAFCVPIFAPTAKRWPQWATRLEFWNQSFSRHGIDLEKVSNASSARDIYQLVAKRKAAAYFGEKSPASARWLPKLARTFPDGRFIIIWRKLEDIHGSVVDAARKGNFTFGRWGKLPRLCAAYCDLTKGVAQLEKEGFQVLNIRYDDLVDDTDGSMRSVCAFLDVEFDPAMVSLQDSDLSAVWGAPLHEHLRGGTILRRSRPPESATMTRKVLSFLEGSGSKRAGTYSFAVASEARWLLIIGRAMYLFSDLKRLLYEIVPLSWLQFYRQRRKG